MMREKGPTSSISEDAAKKRLDRLKQSNLPLVVLDFPVRGISKETNTPREIGDAVRKYFVIPTSSFVGDDDIFQVVRRLQQHMATVRVFASPELHELVVRYLNQAQIQKCVEEVVESIRK
jgi:hypothetical protein